MLEQLYYIYCKKTYIIHLVCCLLHKWKQYVKYREMIHHVKHLVELAIRCISHISIKSTCIRDKKYVSMIERNGGLVVCAAETWHVGHVSQNHLVKLLYSRWVVCVCVCVCICSPNIISNCIYASHLTVIYHPVYTLKYKYLLTFATCYIGCIMRHG